MIDARMTDGRAAHSFPVTAQEEKCRCGRWAAHKIEETTGPELFHPLTAYVCCEHFRMVMGAAHDTYPYEYDDTLSTPDRWAADPARFFHRK